jgi:hypothetical protein
MNGTLLERREDSAVQAAWLRRFELADGEEVFARLQDESLPASDWATYSPEKIRDFTRSLIAAVRVMGGDRPVSSVETGVFAGGTSALIMRILGDVFPDRSVHVGIDPYFTLGQSYDEYADDYGIDAYLAAMKDLGQLSGRIRVPYVPFVMSSRTFIEKDLLPDGFDFRLFHLDGDHSEEAVLSELRYFASKVTDSAFFILDDIGEVFPGVLNGAHRFREESPGFIELRRFDYTTRGGDIGFGVYHFNRSGSCR